MKKDVNKKMTRARSQLIMSQPFFGSLALYLDLVEDPAIETCATDGKKLIFSPTFIDSIKEDELRGVVAHEVLHCAYRHHTRRGERDPDLWNQACDYAINRDLKAGNFVLPLPHLYDRQYDGLNAEQIYSLLAQKNPPKKGGGSGAGADGKNPDGSYKGQPQWGAVLDAAPQGAKAEMAEQDAEWTTRVQGAVSVARSHNAGKTPAAIERLVKDVRAAKVDWRDVLREFIDVRTRSDYSWTNPNKRFLSSGFVLPGIVDDSINHVGIVIDTSGSISAEMLEKFCAELQVAVDDGAADRITVVHCDADVHKIDHFENGDAIKIKPVGGGGTAFSPAFEWFAENEPNVSAIVYFTDLECSDFGESPSSPVLWVVYGDPRNLANYAARVPFGKVVPLLDNGGKI